MLCYCTCYTHLLLLGLKITDKDSCDNNNADENNCRAIVVEITGQIRVENSSGGNCVDSTTRTR